MKDWNLNVVGACFVVWLKKRAEKKNDKNHTKKERFKTK